MESPALRSAPQSTLFDSLKARVVTKAFGLRFGAFGVDYSSKSVEVDPDQVKDANPSLDSGVRRGTQEASTSGRDTRAQAFQAEMERENLRQQLWDVPYNRTGTAETAEAANHTATPETSASFSSHPDPAWRRGLSAYTQARNLLLNDARRLASTRLAVA